MNRRCTAMISDHNFMSFGPKAYRQCPNPATLEVTVKGQDKMVLCDACFPHFRQWATLPWTARDYPRRDQSFRGETESPAQNW